MPVTRHPRTDPCGRFLAHTVLTLDIWIFSANSLQRIRVQDGGSREVLAHLSVKHRTANLSCFDQPLDEGQIPWGDAWKSADYFRRAGHGNPYPSQTVAKLR